MSDYNKIICGDCLKKMAKFSAGTFHAVLTDPPYGVTQDFDDYIATGFLSEAYRVLRDDGALMMFVGQATIREFWNAAEEAGFKWLNTIVWHYKNSMKRERKRFAIEYDPILYFSKGDFVHKIDNVRVPYLNQERLKYPVNNTKKKGWTPNPKGALCGDVWEAPVINAAGRDDASFGHKWQKPLKICERMVKCCCEEDDVILDPFCGVGTLCLAAKKNAVKYIGIEIDEKWAKIAGGRLSVDLSEITHSKKQIDIFEK